MAQLNMCQSLQPDFLDLFLHGLESQSTEPRICSARDIPCEAQASRACVMNESQVHHMGSDAHHYQGPQWNL